MNTEKILMEEYDSYSLEHLEYLLSDHAEINTEEDYPSDDVLNLHIACIEKVIANKNDFKRAEKYDHK